MVKTFIIGAFLGIAAVLGVLYSVPVVDQHREASIIEVSPQGGPSETFHINIPMDRIMIGAQDRDTPLPPGLTWPDDAMLDGTRSELYKLRNSRDAVVGVATRLATSDAQLGNVVEWVMHLPARGSLFVSMSAQPAGGQRVGEMRAGTREFAPLVGRVSERWVADRTAIDSAQAGRIELAMNFVSTERPQYSGEEEAEGE